MNIVQGIINDNKKAMRNFRILLLLLAVLTVSASSCRKDKSEKPDTPAQIEAKSKIIGKWHIEKVIFTRDDAPNDPAVNTSFDETQFLDFKSDLTITFSYSVKNGTFTYTFDETAKTLITSSPNDVYTVLKLTETDLILSKRHNGEIKMVEEITLKKVVTTP